MHTRINKCRLCKNSIEGYEVILDLGIQTLTGVFPKPNEAITTAPVVIIRCKHCNAIQLLDTVEPNEMFGETYGYTSSLNKSMIKHLSETATYCKDMCNIKKTDVVLDIGSNDGTFLKEFLDINPILLGMDPSAVKFKDRYGSIPIITDFFSKKNYINFTNKKAKLVTTIACFYDMQDPEGFAQEVSDILSPEGFWLIEAAYLPTIIEKNCFDGCCHEHLIYYSLSDINKIALKVGLYIKEVSLNDTNGGSFLTLLSKEKPTPQETLEVDRVIKLEQSKLANKTYFSQFTNSVTTFKYEFVHTLSQLKLQGKSIYGLGASTKFNVILQYCNLDKSTINCIYDVNPYKFGRVTPGTRIPIEDEINLPIISKDCYLIVGPYHFKESILSRPKIIEFRSGGGKLVFPLPILEII